MFLLYCALLIWVWGDQRGEWYSGGSSAGQFLPVESTLSLSKIGGDTGWDITQDRYTCDKCPTNYGKGKLFEGRTIYAWKNTILFPHQNCFINSPTQKAICLLTDASLVINYHFIKFIWNSAKEHNPKWKLHEIAADTTKWEAFERMKEHIMLERLVKKGLTRQNQVWDECV